MYADARPAQEYIDWQREFLQLALELVGDSGVICYNIGRLHRALSEDRREDIVQGFPVRQTIIWNRGSTNNQGGTDPAYLPPIYELIYLIAGAKWKLPQRYLSEFRTLGRCLVD